MEDLPGLEVHVIPNMIDPVASDLVPERDPLRVVQLGRLDAVKRVDHAIRAVGIAARTVPGIRLEVYGRGPELEHLLELRSELGLEDVVSFPGFTEDPLEVLAGAAVSLMTSRREGFGLAVAESLAAGTPVVTYDVDYGPAELVENGVNGRVVADGSVEDLAAALVEVLADPEAWNRMSQAAPAAAERLRPDVVAAQWLDLAVDVAARIEVPSGAFLVEDLRVRRAGLDVEGVVIGAVTLPGRVRILGGAEVPLEVTEDPSTGSSRSDLATGFAGPGRAGDPSLVGSGPVAGRGCPRRQHRRRREHSGARAGAARHRGAHRGRHGAGRLGRGAGGRAPGHRARSRPGDRAPDQRACGRR